MLKTVHDTLSALSAFCSSRYSEQNTHCTGHFFEQDDNESTSGAVFKILPNGCARKVGEWAIDDSGKITEFHGLDVPAFERFCSRSPQFQPVVRTQNQAHAPAC